MQDGETERRSRRFRITNSALHNDVSFRMEGDGIF